MPSANACAAAMPTRSPVNGPGPMPPATPDRSRGRTPAAASASRMKPPTTSACRMVSSVPVSASMPPSRSTTATLVPVEVSIARSMGSSLLGGREAGFPPSAGRSRARSSTRGSSAPRSSASAASVDPSTGAPSGRSMTTSSQESPTSSSSPAPHSTTTTERSKSRSRSSSRAALPSRYASTCTSGGPPARFGCVRASTKVGLCTGPRTPRPAPMPRVSVVLPAPSGPVRSDEVAGAQLRPRGCARTPPSRRCRRVDAHQARRDCIGRARRRSCA